MCTIRLFAVLCTTLLCCARTDDKITEITCAPPLPTHLKFLSIVKSAARCLVTEAIPRDARNADFIFVLEISSYLNHTKFLFVKEVLQKLLETTHRNNYGDISPRYAFVFYPLGANQSHIIATEFKNFYSPLHVDTVFDNVANYSRHLVQFNDSISTSSLRYIAVLKSLEALSELTNDKPIGFSIENNRIILDYRKKANKHLVLFLDLFEKQKKKTEQSISHHDINSKIDNMIVVLKNQIDRSSKFVLTVILDPGNKVGTSAYGDPKYGQVYNDGTHFNKAMTLKALLQAKNEQANTLQAHLLHKGVHMQISRLKGLQHSYAFLNPALWTTDGIYSSFIDRCVNGYQCQHCSALHGCYQPKAGKLYRSEKYQMAANFATGGHDSTKSSAMHNNKTWLLDEEQLTIYSLPLSPGSDIKLGKVVDGEVSKLQWSPNKQFAETIIKKGKPVILKNSTVSTWPALQKWTSNYLKRHLATSNILDSVKRSNNYLTFDPDFRVPLKLNISIPFVTANMTKEDFFSYLHDECADGFKGHYYFGQVPDQLKKDMRNDQFMYLTDKDYKAGKQFIWISSAGMITHAHFDQDYNFFIQISGQKRFTLWTSAQHESLYVYPRVHPMWHKSRINFKMIDPQRFPLFLKSQALQVTVGPGDLLYVPPYTWHYVETLTPSVSLSTWSHDYRLYDHMNSIYKYDHKFDELSNPKGM